MILSLVVPVYNGQKYLPGLLGQLRAQACGGVEAVFVDDGSTDASAALVEREAASFPMPLRLLRQENGGVSAARNAGLAAAEGEYVAFVDVDDALAPDYLDCLRTKATSGGFDALFFGIARVLPSEELPACGAFELAAVSPPDLLDEFLRDPKLFGPYSVLLRRAFLRERGLLFAEGYPYYEDYDFLVRAICSLDTALRTDAVLYGYRMADGSAMQRFSAERFLCLALARQTALDAEDVSPEVGARFARWFEARLYWSALWQAGLAMHSVRDVRRILRVTGGSALLGRLAGFPDRKVALTAPLARLCPEAFALLARLLGGSRSRLRRLSTSESSAIIDACRSDTSAGTPLAL